MESVLSSDDSCDKDTIMLKNQLVEFGLEEDNLSKEEMIELLKALKYSKSTLQEDELLRQKADEETCSSPAKVTMKRRYLNVKDRRLPWSLLPSNITPAEKARTLAVYIKLMSINSYRQARNSFHLAAWPPPIQIVESSRIQPLRSTRSGRSVPVYAGFDDDSSDFECVVTKTKKRKVSNSLDNEVTYLNKVISLKRKPHKDESLRPSKEVKINNDVANTELDITDENDLFSLIED